MSKLKLIVLPILLPLCAAAQCSSNLVSSGSYPGASGPAEHLVFMPPSNCYNGAMILFAHEYVAPGSPANAWLSQLALPDGTSLPALVNGLGFGFAASSFSKEGLAILQGIQDTKTLTAIIAGQHIPVQKYFITGASEGGLVTVKSIENDPSYAGGVAVCGPIGSFRSQINYFGDARVLFDYFFPGVLTTGTAVESAINIPSKLIDNWTSVYEPAVVEALNANPLATLQLLSTAKIPIGLSLSNATSAITGVLWYNVFATNDARSTLNGNPYDNIDRHYTGSFDDARLNALVARFAADSTALDNLNNYETTGLLENPLVTLHTIFDPIVPFWQETLYDAKVQDERDPQQLTQIPVLAYGHCNVTGLEAEAALATLLLKTGL
ncbi:MAG TPA: hypothetical protein VIY49_02480 [Bryobacteraceae bacterium]